MRGSKPPKPGGRKNYPQAHKTEPCSPPLPPGEGMTVPLAPKGRGAVIVILMFFNFTANADLLSLVKHLLGNLHSIGSRWPATVECNVGDDLTDLFFGDAV